MIRIFVLATVLSLAFVPSAGAAPGANVSDAGNVSAENMAENVTNATEKANISVSAGSEQEVLQVIDPTVRLLEWQYDGTQFELRIEADRSTSVTLTEVISFEEGTGSGSITTEDLARGINVVTFNVEPRDGEAAVTITTPTSLENGNYRYVSTGKVGGGQSPLEATTSTAGWLGGASVAVSMVGLAAYQVKRKNPSEPEMME